jgi:hypothetical protein
VKLKNLRTGEAGLSDFDISRGVVSPEICEREREGTIKGGKIWRLLRSVIESMKQLSGAGDACRYGTR